jgi:hypothetical protein
MKNAIIPFLLFYEVFIPGLGITQIARAGLYMPDYKGVIW